MRRFKSTFLVLTIISFMMQWTWILPHQIEAIDHSQNSTDLNRPNLTQRKWEAFTIAPDQYHQSFYYATDLYEFCYILACLEPKTSGLCRGKYLRYAYDNKSRNCISFYYSGCGATQNNFLTYEECRRDCMQRLRY